MDIKRTKDYGEMSREAASLIADRIKEKPDFNLGLATGGSPLGTYGYLEALYKNGDISLEKVKGFNLDEYVGLPKDHEQSFYHYLKINLVDRTDFSEKNLFVLDGLARDCNRACLDFEEKIQEEGGIDLQLLGIGADGHIGFNEPDTYFPSMAHRSVLEEETRGANARFFEGLDEVPKEALTMGIGTIMKARELLMLVSGEEKAAALAAALYGPVRPELPASILQFHQKCTVMVDEAAYLKLQEQLEFFKK